MNSTPWSRTTLWLLACLGVATAVPTLDINDARFTQFMPPGPDDVRSSCPGLNTLANHGFLPRDGRGLNISTLMVAAFEGFGVSPETSGLITLSGLIASNKPPSEMFSLAAVHSADWQIEHDYSLSRKDRSEDPNVARFDNETWQATFRELLKKSPIVSAYDFGKAKAASVIEHRMRRPNATYDVKAAGNSATEIAKVMNTLGNLDGWVRVEYLETFFEQEKFPYDLGWRPHRYAADIGSVLGIGALTLGAAPEVLSEASNGRVVLPTDIISAISPRNMTAIWPLRQIIRDAGFDSLAPFDELFRLMSGRLQVIY
ncbi:hypothetical protein G6O67_007889 [Ophiocordyceps sinensis]|uniref:Heme haloperoxidase family profile domain-containing protein n=1 Tax=Ophiocordyceps sinensis TaxID=72228 RepID=A0A8H4LRT2_9HYPO|nr:hypothetical protein G6O67_007889 [Ophiocordyceps sinensis]